MNNFLSTPTGDPVDELYRINSLSMLPRYYEKVLSNLIIKDLKDHSCFHALFWLFNRKKIRLNIKTLIYAILYRIFS